LVYFGIWGGNGDVASIQGRSDRLWTHPLPFISEGTSTLDNPASRVDFFLFQSPIQPLDPTRKHTQRSRCDQFTIRLRWGNRLHSNPHREFSGRTNKMAHTNFRSTCRAITKVDHRPGGETVDPALVYIPLSRRAAVSMVSLGVFQLQTLQSVSGAAIFRRLRVNAQMIDH